MTNHSYVMGIDVGTSSVKVLAVRDDGRITGRGTAPLPAPSIEGDRREQDAELWWAAAADAVRRALADLCTNGGNAGRIAAIAVDGTSGTIVPIDAQGTPLCRGMMYNDGRSREEAEILNPAAAGTLKHLGYRFNASFSLAKILWLYRNQPGIIDRSSCILHQADVITHRLTDGRCVSDDSNALKTGYDIIKRKWPDYFGEVGIEPSKLPDVVPIGGLIGHVGKSASDQFGFDRSCRVVGGMSDGTAACVASGARKPGDGNTTLGTTVVWKLVSSKPIRDPMGRLYSHRHPGGGFLPGGAGNSGGQGIRRLFGGDVEGIEERLDNLTAQLLDGPPSGHLTYPLPSPGERYPFVEPGFEPFSTAGDDDPALLYRSALEGIACIERWGYDVATELGAETGGDIWTTGKGAELDAWMRLRADFLGRPVCRAACPESAYGSALVAAMNVWFDGEWEPAAEALLEASFRCEPRQDYQDICDDQYRQFRDAVETILEKAR